MLFDRLCRLWLLCLVPAVFAVPALRADVTIRYQNQVKQEAGLPPSIDDRLKTLHKIWPEPTSFVRVKGHLMASGWGSHMFILDLDKQEFAVVDQAGKWTATLPVSDLPALLASAFPNSEPASMLGVKPQVESRMTGRKDQILGVQVEEREITVSWKFPPRPGASEHERLARFLWHIWSATRAEASRVPALREIMNLGSGKEPAAIAAMLDQALMGTPDSAVKEAFRGPTVALRTHAELYFPFLAAAARMEAERTGQNWPAIDPDAPVLEGESVVSELSESPIDPSLFEIPKDYRVLPPETVHEAMRAAAAKRASGGATADHPGSIPGGVPGGLIGGIISGAPTGAPPPPPDPSLFEPAPGRIRVGGNVQQAKLIRQPKPIYPPLAKQVRLSGVVKLDAVIGREGTVESLRLVSGHPLLVAAAMASAKEWVYAPTLRNGKPVEVVTQIDVNFTLSAADAPAGPLQ